jgi:hypothetical protein
MDHSHATYTVPPLSAGPLKTTHFDTNLLVKIRDYMVYDGGDGKNEYF